MSGHRVANTWIKTVGSYSFTSFDIILMDFQPIYSQLNCANDKNDNYDFTAEGKMNVVFLIQKQLHKKGWSMVLV